MIWETDPPSLITDTGALGQLVVNRMNYVTQFATEAYNRGMDAISDLGSYIVDVDLDIPPLPYIGSSGVPGITPDEPPAPTIDDPVVSTPAFDGVRPTVDSIDIDSRPVPEYSAIDYGFVIPDPPSVTWPTFSKDAPQASDINVPTTPDIDIPPVPSLDDVSVPSPPPYTIPEFEGEIPVDDLVTPVVSFGWSESAYDSQVKSKLLDSIYNNLVSGGSGLDEETEQAIYDRAKSRSAEEEQALLDNISQGIANRGFDVPPGALMSATLEAENKILKTREDLNNDILVQQSKLAQENTHFIFDKAIQIEQVLISYHSEAQTRSLDAAKFTVTSALQVYGLKVEKYKAKMQAYAILAEAYKARITGEIAKAEFYKAQIEGVKASVAVQQMVIEAYRAQVMSVQALMEAYRTQMEGARVHAEVDKTRIQAYLGEVQAYATRVNAATARFEGYKAQIAGEATKAEMYKADAQAYMARVEGYRAASQVDIARSEAELNQTRAEVEVYRADIARYQADSEHTIAEARVQAEIEGLDVEVFKAHSAKYVSEVDALIRSYVARVEEIKSHHQLEIAEQEALMRGQLAAAEIVMEGQKGAAQAAGQLAAGAMAAVNASLHAASAENRTDYRGHSTSRTASWSVAQSKSLIEQHIYEHET